MEAIENTGEVIGMEAMREIMGPVQEALYDLPDVDFPIEPYAWVFRLGDGAKYVTEEVWEAFWARYPSWYEKAWMVCDNGGDRDGIEDVAALTLEELDVALDRSPLEYSFGTETDEDGYV